MFSPVVFSWPETADTIAEISGNVLSDAEGFLSDASARVDALPPLSYSPSDATPGALSVASDWQQWADVMQLGGRVLCVHPWIEGVGSGQGLHKNLSAKNAVNALTDKLRDKYDNARPAGAIDALCVVLPAASLADLVALLEQFNSVFPLPEFAMVARLAARMAAYENEYLTRLDAIKNPHWSERQWLQLDGISRANMAVGEQLSAAMAYAADTDPRDELRSLIAKKQTVINATEGQLSERKSAFSGGAGRAFFVSAGSPELAADAIADADAGDHADIFTAAFLFTASPGELFFLQEAFGL